MRFNTDSYVAYDADRVFNAAWDYIDTNTKEYDEALEKLIDKEMNRKWFRSKTREAAIKVLKQEFCGAYFGLRVKYKYWFDDVYKIIVIAKLGKQNGEKVLLSSSHADIIWKELAKDWKTKKE